MIRRRALLTASAGLAAGSLPGCSSNDGRIPLWFSYGGKNREVLLSLVERFNQQEPEHALWPVFQGDYYELLVKLRTGLHAGRIPAVTHVVGEILPYLVKANVLERLDQLPALREDFGFLPALSQEGAFRGGPLASGKSAVYGIPFNRSTPIAYLNGEFLDAHGMSAPTTWDELEAFAAEASWDDDGDRRFGFACPIDWWFWLAMVAQAGGEIADAEGRFTLGGDAGADAIRLWQRLVVDKRAMRPPPGRDYSAWDVVKADFVSGRVPMIWNSTAFVRGMEQTAEFRVVCAPLPRRERFGVPTGGTMFVILRGIPARWQEAASRFIAFMARPEASNEFATRTGYIPVTRAGTAQLEADGYYQRVPNDRVALDQLQHARTLPWSPQLFRVQREVMPNLLESAVLEKNKDDGVQDAAAIIAGALRTIEEGL